MCLQLLAPTDAAFDQLLTNLGGANGPLPLDALLAQPTLRDILLYHIIPGRYTSGEDLRCLLHPLPHTAGGDVALLGLLQQLPASTRQAGS